MTKQRILITGGCGFIGCNTAARFASEGHAVTIYDDLSRPRLGVLSRHELGITNPRCHLLGQVAFKLGQ